MAHPLRIVGAPGSPYSRKLRAVLRYRRIPHQWILNFSRESRGLPQPRVALLPVLIFPDESGAPREAATDSTPLIRRLEREIATERSVIPPKPALAFLDALLEDYADEWLTKCMFHYRWAFPADIDYASRVLPRWSAIARSDAEIAPLSKQFAERQIGRLGVVGSNDTTAPAIEASYRRLLALLDAALARMPFLFGARPASSDFALYGQLTQLVGFDPTPMAIARAEAPRVCAWVDVVEDLSGLDVGESGDGWIHEKPVPDALRALFAEVGRVYAPFLLANARALDEKRERGECTIDGRSWVQQPFPYQGKCLRALREGHGALAPRDRATVDTWLRGTGCEVLF
ncbi:MAG TPA: glutathione S-transferase N-terminal domain-containing protein [Myxococcota bacterium]|nr:glutathione S-transferase N-terminal domain-containing protein [Myxococcota bacterium]